jgi:hypothetical protein
MSDRSASGSRSPAKISTALSPLNALALPDGENRLREALIKMLSTPR